MSSSGKGGGSNHLLESIFSKMAGLDPTPDLTLFWGVGGGGGGGGGATVQIHG